MYADDISLACDTAEKLRVAVTTMDATFLRWGLTISAKKTKVLVVGRNVAAQAAESVITLREDQLEVVSQFKYLGSVFNSDCTLDTEITHRVTAANSAFQQLRRVNIWSSRALTLFVKMQFFQCVVMSVLLYSGETWAVATPNCAAIVPPERGCHMHLAHQRCLLQLPSLMAAEMLAAAASVIIAVADAVAVGLSPHSRGLRGSSTLAKRQTCLS